MELYYVQLGTAPQLINVQFVLLLWATQVASNIADVFSGSLDHQLLSLSNTCIPPVSCHNFTVYEHKLVSISDLLRDLVLHENSTAHQVRLVMSAT